MIGFEILNLEHRTDRRDILKGNFITQGVPYKNITFHKAVYGADYPSAKAVCAAAVEDGFPEFQEGCEMGGRGDAAYHWGVMRILEHIASAEYLFEFGYFNQDDRLLPRHWDFQKLVRVVDEFATRDPDFLYLQLCWHASKHTEQEQSIKIGPDKFLFFESQVFYKGICSYGDSGLILSKVGAKYLRERFKETRKWFEALVLEESHLPGTYSLWEPFRLIIPAEWSGYDSEEEAQDRIIVNQMDSPLKKYN